MNTLSPTTPASTTTRCRIPIVLRSSPEERGHVPQRHEWRATVRARANGRAYLRPRRDDAPLRPVRPRRALNARRPRRRGRCELSLRVRTNVCPV